MSITSVKLTQEGSGLSGTGLSNGAVQRSYRSHYRVVTSGPTTSSKEVEAYFRAGTDSDGKPLPYYGRTWKWSPGTDKDVEAICNRFEVNHQPMSAGIFIVEVGFEPQNEESKTKQDSQGNQTDKPDEWFETVQRSYTQMSVVVQKAYFEGTNPPGINNPFLDVGVLHTPCSSNMLPYDPQIEELIDITVIRLGRYVSDLNDADNWQGFINDRDFTITKQNYRFQQNVKKWQGWLKSISGGAELINGQVWWKRDVELWINPRGWVDEYLDKGMHERTCPGDRKAGPLGTETWSSTDFDVGDPMQQAIKGQNGIPIFEPVLLDGNGKPLADQAIKNAVWLKWRTKQQKNLALFAW